MPTLPRGRMTALGGTEVRCAGFAASIAAMLPAKSRSAGGTSIARSVTANGEEPMRKQLTLLVTVAAFGPMALTGARADGMRGGQVVVPDSGVERPGDVGQNAHTNFKFFVPFEPFESPNSVPVNKAVGAPPYANYTFETPASLGCVYGLVSNEPAGAAPNCNPYALTQGPNIGAGTRAIAIVDAYHYPTAMADLTAFSAQFGLPLPTASSFQVVYARARKPAVNSNWNVEEALDIEWAHAMSPNAVIYLVEANSSSITDLLNGVKKANSLLAQGGVVSMSWGGSEFLGETLYDSYFSGPNIVYFAAAGDNAGVIWPSVSPRVVSVGGTSTSRVTTAGTTFANFISQTTWQDGGGGPSAYEALPAFQQAALAGKFSSRATPDVAADANPSTGVYVYEAGSWYGIGGTSVATPIWAGIVSSAGDSSSTGNELTRIYGELSNAGDFFDIATGTCGPGNGYSAVPGWDPCTGAGAPNTLGGK